MAYDFGGKRALVTGAGGGIGKEIVKNLVKCKADVIALDIHEGNLNILKKEIPTVSTVCVDLSDWKATRKAVEKLGVIDLLVNNAGILREGTFEEITEEDFDRMFAVNVKPIVNISQVVIKALKDKGKPGAIVNMASASVATSALPLAAYAATKVTVDKLTKTMAVELAAYGIRINAVNPSYVRTAMTSKLLEGENAEKPLRRIPLRKFIETKDVASAVTFLLSDEAKMITGTSLFVDGGNSIA